MVAFRAASAAVLLAQGITPPAGGLGPPPAPPGTDPMRDVDLMAEELRHAWRRYCEVIDELDKTTAELESLRTYKS